MKTAIKNKRSKRPELIECFVAACSGTARLSDKVGQPVVHVGMSEEAAASIEELNAKEYGNGALWPNSFQPLEPQSGWNDWSMFRLEATADAELPHPRSAVIEDGLDSRSMIR